MKQALLKITGKVQGVFFRAHARDEAVRLGLTGYAKNMPDGSVEALAQGEESELREFIEWAREGSPSANVDTVEVEWQEITENYDDFETY